MMLFNKNKRLFKCLLLSVIAFITLTTLHAATQPKFTFTPTTPTKWTLPVNGETTVQYRVTNQLTNTYTLTMAPLPNVAQRTSEAGDCSNPFTLAHQESCLLTLPLIGSQLTQDLIGGPIVCKTKGYGNNTPDPFLCSQPSSADQLNIRRAGFEEAKLSVSPATITLSNGVPQSLTVTNHSLTVTALNIEAILPDTLSPYVTQDSTNCDSVAPEASCQITFTATNNSVAPTTIEIKGTNTTTTTAIMSIGYLSISVSPTSLTLEAKASGDGTSGTLTITNNAVGTGFNALNITTDVDSTALYSHVSEVSSGCGSVAPNGGTCTLTYTAEGATGASATIKIQGENTLPTYATITVTQSGDAMIEITDGTPMWLIPNGEGLTMTIKNTSTLYNAEDIGVTFGSSGYVSYSSACPSDLPPGDSCDITFTPIQGSTDIRAMEVSIQATNTNAVTGEISVEYVLYVANYDGNSITKCSISAGNEGVELENCMDSGATLLDQPKGLAITYYLSNFYYLSVTNHTSSAGSITTCHIDQATGLLTDCENATSSDSSFKNLNDITFDSTYTHGYITGGSDTTNSFLKSCPVLNGVIYLDNDDLCQKQTSNSLNLQGVVLNTANTVAWMGNYDQGYLGKSTISLTSIISPIGNTTASISGNQLGIILSPTAIYAYVALVDLDTVYRCTIDGTDLSTCVEISSSGSLQLNEPHFMALSIEDNNIYITNAGNDSIVRCGVTTSDKSFDNCGAVTLTDSSGSTVTLNNPSGIAVLNLP